MAFQLVTLRHQLTEFSGIRTSINADRRYIYLFVVFFRSGKCETVMSRQKHTMKVREPQGCRTQRETRKTRREPGAGHEPCGSYRRQWVFSSSFSGENNNLYPPLPIQRQHLPSSSTNGCTKTTVAQRKERCFHLETKHKISIAMPRRNIGCFRTVRKMVKMRYRQVESNIHGGGALGTMVQGRDFDTFLRTLFSSPGHFPHESCYYYYYNRVFVATLW